MKIGLEICSKTLTSGILSAALLSCGLGVVGTSAQNNSAASPQGATATPSSPDSSTTASTPAVTTDPAAQNTTATTSQTTATTVSTVPASVNTPTTTTTDPATPSTSTTSTPVGTGSSTTTSSSTGTSTTSPTGNPYEVASLSHQIFSWNPQTGAFTAILSSDRAVCTMRSQSAVKQSSRELQITATVFESGGTLSVKDVNASLVQYSSTCTISSQATLGPGVSKLELDNLTTSSVTASYLFSLTMGSDGTHTVTGMFSAASCSGLSNGVPHASTCSG